MLTKANKFLAKHTAEFIQTTMLIKHKLLQPKSSYANYIYYPVGLFNNFEISTYTKNGQQCE